MANGKRGVVKRPFFLRLYTLIQSELLYLQGKSADNRNNILFNENRTKKKSSAASHTPFDIFLPLWLMFQPKRLVNVMVVVGKSPPDASSATLSEHTN